MGRRSRGKNLSQALDDMTQHRGQVQFDKPQLINIDAIVADEEIQVRVEGLDQEWIEQLVAVLENDGTFDAIIVYETDELYLLADGFHRVEAHRRVGMEQIKAIVRAGTREDALTYAEEANMDHGLQLTTDDKRNILLRRLRRQHPWSGLSNRQIAARMGVSDMTIGRWIKEFELTATNVAVRDETIGADGKVRKKKAPSRTKSVERTGKPLITKEGKKLFRSIMQLGDGVNKAPPDTKEKLLEDIDLAQQYLDELRRSLEE